MSIARHHSEIATNGLWLAGMATVAGMLLWVLGSSGVTALLGGLLFAIVGLFVWHARQLRLYLHWSAAPWRRPIGLQGVWARLANSQSRTQQRARQRSRGLMDGLRRFRAATAALPDAAILIRRDGTIDWINPSAGRLLGLSSQDVDRRLSTLLRHPRIVELLSEGPESGFMEIESPVQENVFLELRLVEADNDRRLLLVRDTTQIQRLMTMRQDFIANVSHELRTPLTVIVGYLETLEDEQDSIDLSTLQTLLARLSSPALRMRALVNDLLLLSRLDSSERPPFEELTTFEVGPMLRALAVEARQLGDHDHEIELIIEGPARIRGVEQEIHSAFNNLIVNAVRYSPDGGHIRVRWQHDQDGARFSVSDEGLGIPGEHLGRLTERFYRVDVGRSRGTGGTGLGLAIVKHVLRRHESELEIASVVGEGSTFACRFGRAWLDDHAAASQVSTGIDSHPVPPDA